MGHLSWTTFVILASAAIMPTTPRKMLAACLLAASLEPLGVWWAHLRGIAVPGIVETLALMMPNYVSALVATVPSQVFQGLGRRLREAQALGSYQLVELLGRGGMGEVWRAQHRWLVRHAAIKLIRPENARRPRRGRRGGRPPAVRTRSSGHSQLELAAQHPTV